MHKEKQENYNSIGKGYWWLGGKYEILIDMMNRHIKHRSGGSTKVLDIGCGPGLMADSLKKFGDLYGIDISPDAANFAKERGYKEIAVSDIIENPYLDNNFDLAVAIDILEHTEDDSAAIRQINRILRPGGYFIFGLPAYNFLWSSHDEQYGHFRRYTVAEAKRKLTAGGFEPLQITYIEPAFVAPLFLMRKIKKYLNNTQDDFIKMPKLLNDILYKVIASEKYILRFGNIPFGASIVGIVQKSLK